MTRRAHTTRAQKLGLLGLSVLRAGVVTVFPTNPVLFARPLPEVAFLVDAAAHPDTSKSGWGESVISVLSQLEARDRAQDALARTA